MITPIAIVLALSCPQTKIENASGLEWVRGDDEALASAKKRCPEIYPDAPCLKWFRKYEFQAYDAICGAPKKG